MSGGPLAPALASGNAAQHSASDEAIRSGAIEAALSGLSAQLGTLSADDDPIIDVVADHRAALDAIDEGLRAERNEREMLDAMRRADALLYRVLTTPPRSLSGLSVLLQHLARHEWENPEGPTILAGAQEAGDDGLRDAADSFLARLGTTVLAIRHF